MADVAVENRIAAATAYEELFVPALFQHWAERVADAARIQPGQRPLVGIVLPEEQILRILKEAEKLLGGYVTSNGDVRFETPAHIVTWRKP